MIFFYRTLTFLLFPVFSLITYLRRFINKEHKQRFREKISIKENYFPKNKKIFWIHAASIGETKSTFPLIDELIKNNSDIFILLTSTTLTSSQLIEREKFNYNNFQHRFFPLDVRFLVKKFLDHWKPELIIFVDSEIWPNYLFEISKKAIPLVLLNGRISNKTFRLWKLFPNFSKRLFFTYDLCLSSSKQSEKNLRSLGAKNVKYLGNLKFCSKIDHEKKNNNLISIFNGYNIWCSASTHPGEEEIILKTHCLLKKKKINVLTIIIPRHIVRSKEIHKMCKNFNLTSQIINKFDEISKHSEILIVNSIGEVNKYFNNCKSILMGKSFSKNFVKVGGQNPIEPAKCGCKIYHGPYVSNFEEIYNFLNEKKVAYKVNNEIELSENLFKDFKFNDNKNQKNIEQLNKYGDEILSSTKKEILKLKNEI